MPPNDCFQDDQDTIQRVVETVNSKAYDEVQTDLHLCFTRPINYSFMISHNYCPDDIRSILGSLRIEDYCHTSREEGKPNAYVFSPDTREDYSIYLKVAIKNGVIVISFHEPDRPLSFPFRIRRKTK